MFEKVKRFLSGCLEVVAALFVFLAMMAYIGLTAITLTFVINDLRLDTYMSLGTGVEIVMLIALLVWAPIFALCSFRQRR
jgi:hypothetical protein